MVKCEDCKKKIEQAKKELSEEEVFLRITLTQNTAWKLSRKWRCFEIC